MNVRLQCIQRTFIHAFLEKHTFYARCTFVCVGKRIECTEKELPRKKCILPALESVSESANEVTCPLLSNFCTELLKIENSL